MPDHLGEFELIERYLRPLANDPNAFGLTDDAALLDVPDGKQLVVSKDVLIAGRHFFVDDPPNRIAQKALRTNVSDLIAKGATPYRFSLGLVFPKAPKAEFMDSFTSGLRADQELYGWSLIGGDTTKSLSDFMISITAYGLCDEGGMIKRAGAQPGDAVFVSGTLGDSALGLHLRRHSELFVNLTDQERTELLDAYLLPSPRHGLEKMIASYASASMDISDGLFADLAHMCQGSGVSAEIKQTAIPLSMTAEKAIKAEPELLTVALRGGDDYQCLMAVSPECEDKFLADCRTNGFKVRKIGVLVEQTDPLLKLTSEGEAINGDLAGFTHF